MQEACDAAGILLLYLPAYSPDFNLIKPAFHCLKSWMKRYRRFAPAYNDEDVHTKFTQFLLQACEDFTANGGHKGLWRDAGIKWELEDGL